MVSIPDKESSLDLTRGKAGLLDKIGGRYVNQESNAMLI
jgi:hypothetical protein